MKTKKDKAKETTKFSLIINYNINAPMLAKQLSDQGILLGLGISEELEAVRTDLLALRGCGILGKKATEKAFTNLSKRIAEMVLSQSGTSPQPKMEVVK